MEARAGRVLVVCTKSMIYNWVRSTSQWAGEDASVLTASMRSIPDSPWVVTNYEAARRHVGKLQHGFDCLIVDEAHRIKNRRGRRWRADGTTESAPVQRTAVIHAIARSVQWCRLLTATPAQNHPAELWSLLHALYPDIGGALHRHWEHFGERFVVN